MVTIEDQGLSYVQYRCDGSTVNFMLTFPYLRQQDISVFLNGVLVSEDDWSWLSEGEIQMDTAPALDDFLTIKRTTEQSARLVDFQDGGQVSEETLDLDSNQLFYLSQEAIDTTNFNLAIDSTDATIDARGNKIINVGDPADAGDAVNLQTMEDADAAVLASASAIANAAVSTANTALSTANTALSTANAAETTANAIASTANTALTNANAAVVAAAAAQATADGAVTTANAIEALAQQGVDNAATAQSAADAAQATADSAQADATAAQSAADAAQGSADAANDGVTALTSALGDHISDTSTHGVTGNVVGTTDTQTLTNKTMTAPVLNSPSVVTPSRSDVKQDTKANLDTYAATATNGQMCFATDLKQMYQVVDGLLSSVGGSTGTLNTIVQYTGDEGVASWATGDNASFLGGGTISGTFVKNTTTPFQGLSDFKYTQAAGSLNDYMASPAFAIDPRFRGKEVTLVMQNTYDGSNNDIEVIFYDVTNAAIIPSSAFIQAGAAINVFKTNVVIPSTCASMRIGFMTRVLNSGKIFRFDSIELTADTTIMAQLANMQDTTSFTASGQWTTNVTYSGVYTRFGEWAKIQWKWDCSNTPTGATQILNMPAGLVIDSSKLKITAPNNYVGLISDGTAWDNSAAGGFPLYAEYQGNTGQVAAMIVSAAGTYAARAGVSTTVPFSAAASDSYVLTAWVPIVGWVSNNPNIVTSPEVFSSDRATFVYAGSSTYTLTTLADAPIGTYITFTYTASTVNVKNQSNAAAPTQTSANMNSDGVRVTGRIYSATGATATPPLFAIQIGKGHLGVSLRGYSATGKSGNVSLSPFRESTNAQYGLIVDGYSAYNPTTGILLLDAGTLQSTSITTRGFWNDTGNVNSDVYITISASKNPALIGLNTNAVGMYYTSSSGQSIANAAYSTVVMGTKVYDTHNSYNNSSGQYTAPETGYYAFDGLCTFVPFAVASSVIGCIYKNGALLEERYSTTTTTNNYWVAAISGTIFLTKGETCSFVVYQNSGTRSLDASAIHNYLSIQKVNVG